MIVSPVIFIEDLSFSYNGAIVLEDVNLSIDERAFVWVVGPNGGGKTTLLRLMLGLLRPTRGSVRVFGRSPREARTRLGYMPQQVSLDPRFPANVMDIVLMGRLGRGSRIGPHSMADRRAAARALEMVDMYKYRHKSIPELSGGQQRRLFIARALSCEPDLLLLDEPTANLDPLVQHELLSLLHSLNEHLTVIMVSHDPAFVSESVKQVICVKQKVHVHPTGEIDGSMLRELYGRDDLRIVRHDRHFGNGEPHD